MNTKPSILPTTGKVLAFLINCLGESKNKGVRGQGSNAAQYKRIERLAKRGCQSEEAASEVKTDLIDAVAGLFDISLKEHGISKEILEMKFPARVPFCLGRALKAGRNESSFAVILVFWIVYFLEHHEWLWPQLEAAHKVDAVLWEWIEDAAHFYSREMIDAVRMYPSLFAGLPKDSAWNLPTKDADGTVQWPLAYGFEWLGKLLTDEDRGKLAEITFPNTTSANSYRRMLQGKSPLKLDKIEAVANHKWNFKPGSPNITSGKIKAVLLWCRALEYALRKVEKRFGLDSVWLLVDWHKQASASQREFYETVRRGGENSG